jgi:hypothetical protein
MTDTEPSPAQAHEEGRWLRLELLGHRQRAGYVTEVTLAGAAMLHIDLPAKVFDGEQDAWEEYAPAALYGVSPATEQEIRGEWEAEKRRREEVQRWREEQDRRPALLAGFGGNWMASQVSCTAIWRTRFEVCGGSRLAAGLG